MDAEEEVLRRFRMKGEGMSMRYCKKETGSYGIKPWVIIRHWRA